MLRYEERLASFHDVVDFVKDEAALATDPVFSPDALKETRTNESASNSSSNVKNTMWRNNGKGEKRAQLASLQVPHLKARNPHLDFLRVQSATVKITT